MPEERMSDEALNRLWNALVQSSAEPPFDDLDPLQAETVRHLHAMTRMPPPMEMQLRLDQTAPWLQPGIDATPSPNGHGRSAPRYHGSETRGADRLPLFARPAEPVMPQPVRHLHWPSLPIGTAMLLVVTLSLAYITAGPGRPFIEQRAILPAVSDVASVETMPAPTSSTMALTMETIFATTLPAETVPTDGHLTFGFYRLALDPGVSTRVSPAEQSCCWGPLITHVLSGELTANVDGPMQIFRGASLSAVPIDVAPQTATVVRAGDTIIHDVASPAAYSNQGTSPVQIVNIGLYAGTLPSLWVKHLSFLDGSEEFPDPLPAGPLAVSLVRAVLPPDAEVPAPPRGALVLEVGENGDASIGKRTNDGVLFNIGAAAETIYIVMLQPLGTPTLSP